MKTPSKDFGIVILLDALGTRQRLVDDIDKFLADWDLGGSDIIVNVIEDMQTTNIHLCNNKRIVKLLYDPVDVFVNADKVRITQVISNLLSNAIKFIRTELEI
jgi:signal transduction histidine kinase